MHAQHSGADVEVVLTHEDLLRLKLGEELEVSLTEGVSVTITVEPAQPAEAQPGPITMVATPESSSIEARGYDAATRTLAIRFSSGALYHYHDVPAEVYQELVAAKSAGAFYAQRIRGTYMGHKQG